MKTILTKNSTFLLNMDRRYILNTIYQLLQKIMIKLDLIKHQWYWLNKEIEVSIIYIKRITIL